MPMQSEMQDELEGELEFILAPLSPEKLAKLAEIVGRLRSSGIAGAMREAISACREHAAELAREQS